MKILNLLREAWAEITLQPFRSFLTALGIVFGVGAVIAILAISEGAKREAVSQLEVLGAGTIRVRESDAQANSTSNGVGTSGVYVQTRGWWGFSGLSGSMGSGGPARPLDMKDLEAVKGLEGIDAAASERTKEVSLPGSFGDISVTVVGTTSDYLKIQGLKLQEGRFFDSLDIESRNKVAVIGPKTRGLVFGTGQAIGNIVRIDNVPYTIIGVVSPKDWSGVTLVQIRDTGKDVYIPVTTMAIGTSEYPVGLNEIILRLKSGENPVQWGSIVEKIVSIAHPAGAFEVIVPEELLAQQQELQRIFSVVMGLIASISLIVGGIGIMNISLATVIQRTREIGIRRALGARKKDIQAQFLSESFLISVLGGAVGIFLGYALSKAVSSYAGWSTAISGVGVVVAFSVAATVGVIFGWWPAKIASEMPPVDALRHE